MTNNEMRFDLPKNEPILAYTKKSKERIAVREELDKRKQQIIDIPQFIGGKEIRTNNTVDLFPPHQIKHKIGQYHKGNNEHIQQAINAALEAKTAWQNLPWQNRMAIFQKAADLVSGKYRASINAATMLAQSKNIFQAEIDAACELADFLRFNVYYASQIYKEQPINDTNIRNSVEYRPLEGFVYAATPFNFTAIAANLFAAPALMGNVVVWKPSPHQIYSAYTIMQIFREAGLPNGVVNMIFTDAIETSKVIYNHPDFAALHFTGSTFVFQEAWKQIGLNIEKYKTYPRIVGETGGKDFMFIHHSADINVANTALLRAAFEYQGQKCSACSRAYIPKSIWENLWEKMYNDLKTFKQGSVEDFSTMMNAVISKDAFDRITQYIEDAKANDDNIFMFGGNYDATEGYFIEPTVILTKNPKSKTMEEEIFGPVLTIYLYDDDALDETLQLLDETSPYALTGGIIAQDTYAINYLKDKLSNNAGNFYINDKCTGAVVGQQPFGGARKSGTNDKAGSKFHLLRFVSPRTVKENFSPPTHYKYPYMKE